MINNAIITLTPTTLFQIHIQTGISQAELELRYLGAKENGEYVEFTITTLVTSTRKKKYVPICRECRDGKHFNCDGSALNLETDEIVKCMCLHTAHSGATIKIGL